jgi:adenylate cyclase
VSQSYTFAFVDLAGFTALTDHHGDQAAADQIRKFGQIARDCVTGTATVVNVVGDAVLVAADDVGDGVDSTLALLEACIAEPQFPLARGGLHTGTAVRSGSDFFGSGVNVAARVAARAGGGELMLTGTPAKVAYDRGRTVHELGLVELRNVASRHELFRIDLARGAVSLDPVCRMTVQQPDAAGSLTHGGHTYWFCSLECAGAFAIDPVRHASNL